MFQSRCAISPRPSRSTLHCWRHLVCGNCANGPMPRSVSVKNIRNSGSSDAQDSGVHICLRATDTRAVEDFHAAALKAGGTSDGAPGPRTEYHSSYYAAFVRDPDGNRIEAVTFLREAESK